MNVVKRLALAFAAVLATFPAGAQSASMSIHHHMLRPSGNASPASKAYQAAMATMHRKMAITYSGDPDVDFVRGMLPHHQGAIDMAKVELQYGRDPAIRKLAQGIVEAQQKEINDMQAWLAARGR